ncbi:LOW QUALITY PROTEIN: hypothetical protein KUTeg_005081 [Tegillarca granosa]|uniref:Uncharacterized protein n=1 Tax=Tegillarca granosa TaxID=220873 RepID=A0ABQ9FKQ9_TEGGR|nr:LOW QUALITY PROTEIN: hypothetical protein KUTeg_005081 [Tegillarca granosa]
MEETEEKIKDWPQAHSNYAKFVKTQKIKFFLSVDEKQFFSTKNKIFLSVDEKQFFSTIPSAQSFLFPFQRTILVIISWKIYKNCVIYKIITALYAFLLKAINLTIFQETFTIIWCIIISLFFLIFFYKIFA